MIEKTTILFFIPVWKRPKVTEACYKGLKRIIEAAPDNYDFETLIVYSEPEHAELATRYGLRSFYADNEPLGRKFNAGMEYALNNLQFDYVFQLNSDNIIANNVWNQYQKHFDDRVDFFGTDKLFMYHPATQRLKFYIYHDGCGAARVIRRDIIEKAGWCVLVEHLRSAVGDFFQTNKGDREYIAQSRYKKNLHKLIDKKPVFRLWNPDRMKGMDNNSARAIFKACKNYPMKIPRHERDQVFVLDIKTDVNIWGYDQLVGVQEDISGQEKAVILSRFKEATDLIIKIKNR